MVFRRRDTDIDPTGTGVGAGAGAIKGLAERNLDNLLKVFSKKESTEALTALAKTDDSTWTEINASIFQLNRFIEVGGAGKILSSIRETVEINIEAALSPLTNTINQGITDWMTENITPILNEIANDLSQYITDNPTGALVGGVAGQIASIFLPGGPLLVILGSLIGAAVEDIIQAFVDRFLDVDEDSPFNPVFPVPTGPGQYQAPAGVGFPAGSFMQGPLPSGPSGPTVDLIALKKALDAIAGNSFTPATF